MGNSLGFCRREARGGTGEGGGNGGRPGVAGWIRSLTRRLLLLLLVRLLVAARARRVHLRGVAFACVLCLRAWVCACALGDGDEGRD